MDMKAQFFTINSVPAVLYGEDSAKGWLFVHGQMGHKEEAEAFAQIVSPKGLQVLAIDLPGHGARQGLAEEAVPWTAAPEIQAVVRRKLGKSALEQLFCACQQHWSVFFPAGSGHTRQGAVCFSHSGHERTDLHHDDMGRCKRRPVA